MRFSVLGPLEVDDGQGSVPLGGRKQRLLLAHLLRRQNGWVPTETLIDDIWGEEPPEAVRNSLQSYVSHLRKIVGVDRLEARNGSYRIVLTDDELDAAEFERLTNEAREVLSTDPSRATDLFREALGLWRGPAFADLSNDRSLQGEIGRLQEARLHAIEDRITAELSLGHHAELVEELEALTRDHHLRERLWGQRMLALYRSERPGDALAAYREARGILVTELGIEPGRPLQQLHERILVQDPGLDLAPADGSTAIGPGNPYKGLRPFREDDVEDFYGREELTEQLIATVDSDARMITVVGPSGSGKSSVLHAGMIPALRKLETPGSSWKIVAMRPGGYPFLELAGALARSFPGTYTGAPQVPRDRDTAVLEAILRVLPDDGSRLLLVIDQFEELFTLVDSEARERFISALMTAAQEPLGRVRVLAALRADFFDRPLAYPALGKLMTEYVVHVLPLGSGELEAAANEPAARMEASLEPALVAELVGDVSHQPNALPLFQYALTELFDRREGNILTLQSYEAIGGLQRAVASRAEDTFTSLDADQQEAARQLMLRLVTVGTNSRTRRVLSAGELASLNIDLPTMQGALEAFVSNRLLSTGRDPISGDATIEVAHEALLSEWDRLDRWIDSARDDLRVHAGYVHAVEEWLAADRDPDYLLTGGRLASYEEWRATTTLRLTDAERRFLEEAVQLRDEARAAGLAKQREEERRRRRGGRRAFSLGVAAAAVMAGVVIGALILTASDRPSITWLSYGDPEDNQVSELAEQGIARAERDLGVEVQRADVLLPPQEVVAAAAETDVDLLVLDEESSFALLDHPELLVPPTRYVVYAGWEDVADQPNVTRLAFAYEQSGFIAGVAAASTSETGTIGYIGAVDFSHLPAFRAGYEAGARWVDPDVEILAANIADFSRSNPFQDLPTAKALASMQYQSGADVIFHAAGRSGFGVFEAATELSTTDRHLWAIGVDTDQWQTASNEERPHILTSSIIRYDLVDYSLIRDFVEGTLEPGLRAYTVEGGVLTYSTSGNGLSSGAIQKLDEALKGLRTSDIEAPTEPTGELMQQ